MPSDIQGHVDGEERERPEPEADVEEMVRQIGAEPTEKLMAGLACRGERQGDPRGPSKPREGRPPPALSLRPRPVRRRQAVAFP